MLDGFPVYPVLPASDIGRAKAWYEEKLGMAPSRESQSGLWYECGEGTWLFLSDRIRRNRPQHAGALPGHRHRGGHGRSSGPRGGVRAVRSFRDYQSEDGIIEIDGYKVVFVKDSEGNTIEIAQVPSGS
jgi:catechol 2,3-dioxygenase-like lactoylglutathione lyase family enzyme